MNMNAGLLSPQSSVLLLEKSIYVNMCWKEISFFLIVWNSNMLTQIKGVLGVNQTSCYPFSQNRVEMLRN